MDYLQKIIIAIELHDADGIRTCFENGVSPAQIHRGKPLVYELLSGYLRSPAFAKCIQTFLDYGWSFSDSALQAVLLDDADTLAALLPNDSEIVHRQYRFDCAFTPMHDVTLLHICAEFNHVACARILLEHHADIHAKAGVDPNGFGAQTPIFHTVNQHNNYCTPMLKLLLDRGAAIHTTVKGLIWGQGQDWETYIPSVNPISYAMMGLLPQFQRNETDIYANIHLLMQAGYQIDYLPKNVPNRYLTH